MRTIVAALPSEAPSAAENLRRGQITPDAHQGGAPANPLPAGHCSSEAQPRRARGNHLAGDQFPPATQGRCVPGNPLGGDQSRSDAQCVSVAAELLFCAEYLDDVERVRIATENRLRSMVQAGIDAEPYVGQLLAFKRIEHEATLALQRVLRRHPFGAWVKAQRGIGEKQGARLIAAIGDVAWNHLEDRPRRGPAELWAYCGYVPGQRRSKGVKSNWNAAAKSRSYCIAESMLKAGNREVYDRARASKAGFVHDGPCQICAGKGKPAGSAIGTPWKDGHAHAHALRVTAKDMLKELFLEAKRVGA